MAERELGEVLASLRSALCEEFRLSLLHRQCSPRVCDVGTAPNSDGRDLPRRPAARVGRREVLTKIEEVVCRLLSSLGQGEAPALAHDSRSSWENVRFYDNCGLEILKNTKTAQVRWDSFQSVRKFSLMFKVLSIIYRLVQSDSHSTKRDIYYHDTKTYRSQSVTDSIIDDLSYMLEVPRWDLHILATSKGCLAGDLQFYDKEGNYFDCRNRKTGILIPNHVKGINNMHSEAKFVLVVEKDATFQHLLANWFCEKFSPCIIVTGKGFPDVNTRMILRKLWDQFQVPTFLIADADPHGIEIMAVYKFGSKVHLKSYDTSLGLKDHAPSTMTMATSLAFETEFLAVPSMKWLGIFPSDIGRLRIPESMTVPLTKIDREKAKNLLHRPYVKSNETLNHEIKLLLNQGVKAEIQSLNTLSYSFLIDIYIPGKIKCAGWI